MTEANVHKASVEGAGESVVTPEQSLHVTAIAIHKSRFNQLIQFVFQTLRKIYSTIFIYRLIRILFWLQNVVVQSFKET